MPNPTDHGRDYLVAPRFLAGPTYTGDHVLDPLRNAGWTLSHDELGNFFAATPDHTVRVAYLPEGTRGDLWVITAHHDAWAAPEWQVTVDLAAAPEIVAELTTTLAAAQSAAYGSVVHGPTGGFDLTYRLLDEHSWQQGNEPARALFRSPDGLVTLYRHLGHLDYDDEMTGDLERWTIKVGPPGHRWYATATSNTPDRFLETLTNAVTDPAPVQRHLRRSELSRLPAQATATPTAPSPLEVARVRAASSRSLSVPRTAPTPGTGGSVLAYTTTTRPISLPKSAPAGRAR
ncbi:DUF317 domain-containing protein [Kitasatospora phosalacinea]|uniref:DUF317 domain-containing protein n=1 Tax=Kitasatospora phosalacinea TaxID=2065 RepID=UPI0035E22036